MTRRVALRRTLCLSLLLMAISSTAPGRASELPPAEVLASHGLARLPQSTIWATKLEHEVRSRLNDLPLHRDAIAALEQALSEQIEANSRQWIAAKQTESSLNITLASLASNDPTRSDIVKRRAQVLAQSLAPERLNQRPNVCAELIELGNRRHALWITLLAVRRDAPRVAESYGDAAKASAVTAALRKLGANHRLGPARNYGDELRKLGDIERAVLTDWLPLFSKGGRQRVTVLINETAPTTFTWTSSAEPTVLTSSMAHAAGLQIPANAKRSQVTLAKGRTYAAAQITIPQLRLGKHLLKEVPALVLPPEGEDLGARLGSEAFSDLRVYPQPERLRLLVEAAR